MGTFKDYYEDEWIVAQHQDPYDYFRARPGDFPDLDAEEDDEEDDDPE